MYSKALPAVLWVYNSTQTTFTRKGTSLYFWLEKYYKYGTSL